jgi:hypothetical protein
MRTEIQKQRCACRNTERTPIAISIMASTLGTVPRRKSKNLTVYICSRCIVKPKPRTCRQIMLAVVASAVKANRRPHRKKPQHAKKMTSGAHRRPSLSGNAARPSQSKLRRKTQ